MTNTVGKADYNPSHTVQDLDDTPKASSTKGSAQASTDSVVQAPPAEGTQSGSITADSLDKPREVSAYFLPEAYNGLDKLQGAMATIHTLMLMMVEMNIENKQAARALKGAERELQQQDLKAAAQKIREAANLVFAAAIVSGVVKIGSGAISIGAGIHGLAGLKGADDLKIEQVRTSGRIWDGSAKLLEGSGDLISGALTREGEMRRAEQTELEASAQRHETVAQSESEFEQSLKESIQGVMQILQGLMQLSETEKKIANV